jgi:hypothetical protein
MKLPHPSAEQSREEHARLSGNHELVFCGYLLVYNTMRRTFDIMKKYYFFRTKERKQPFWPKKLNGATPTDFFISNYFLYFT